MPMEPGQSLRECNAYEGSEVANRFVMIEPLWGWRTVNITGQHISCDIAGRVRLLADEDYPKAKRIVLIVDHLNTQRSMLVYYMMPEEKTMNTIVRWTQFVCKSQKTATISALVIMMMFIINSMPSHAHPHFAVDSPAIAKDVLQDYVNLMDKQEWNQISLYWVSRLRSDFEAFLTDSQNQASATGLFNIQSARLVELKRLSADIAGAYVNLDSYVSEFGDAQVFYVGVDYKVKQEDKYHYNGVNYRLATLVPEEGQWKLVEFSNAPVENLVTDLQGFGSFAESEALRVDRAHRKGLFINPAGKILEDLRPDDKSEQLQWPNPERNSEVGMLAVGDHTRPSTIRVYLTRPANLTKYGCSSACTRTIDFQHYVRNVLPNEWSDPNWAAAAYRTGAHAVKGYGWYRVYYPKWSSLEADVKDNTEDQVYLKDTEKAHTNDALNYIGWDVSIERVDGMIFQTQHELGQENDQRDPRGTVWQLGTKYWTTSPQDKGYSWMLQFYYNNTRNTAGKDIRFFCGGYCP
jgi:hypothetical protein